MPGQDKAVFERPVTRSQTKSDVFKFKKSHQGHRHIYGPATFEASTMTYPRRKWSAEPWRGDGNKIYANDSSSRDAFKYSTKAYSNKNANDSYRFTSRISEWSPETPDYTPDCLSEYGFEDVFDQAFANALATDSDYTTSNSPYSPLSPISPYCTNEADNDSDVDIEDEIIDIESFSPPKTNIQIDDDLKYRFDLESETASEPGDQQSSACSPEYITPEYITPESCVTEQIYTTSRSIYHQEEIEDLILLDGERVTAPFTTTETKQPITREILLSIKSGLDLEDTEQAMFWCLCTLAFHSLARLNELVANTESPDPLQIEVKQVKAPNIYVVPYACIRIPYAKNERAKIRHLVVCPSNNDVCPLTALSNYCRIRTQEGYASDSDPFFCFQGGKSASRPWFLKMLRPFLPNGETSSYSFRIGGVLDMIAMGRTKPDIRCLGRWDYNTFEQYLNEHPSILLAFISASISNAYEQGESSMIC